jgi:hypothetical protein
MPSFPNDFNSKNLQTTIVICLFLGWGKENTVHGCISFLIPEEEEKCGDEEQITKGRRQKERKMGKKA